MTYDYFVIFTIYTSRISVQIECCTCNVLAIRNIYNWQHMSWYFSFLIPYIVKLAWKLRNENITKRKKRLFIYVLYSSEIIISMRWNQASHSLFFVYKNKSHEEIVFWLLIDLKVSPGNICFGHLTVLM